MKDSRMNVKRESEVEQEKENLAERIESSRSFCNDECLNKYRCSANELAMW